MNVSSPVIIELNNVEITYKTWGKSLQKDLLLKFHVAPFPTKN